MKATSRYNLFRVRDQQAQALIVGALGIAILLGFVALAVDVGVMFHTRRATQAAADAGAIAGAQTIKYGGDPTIAARADSARNGFEDGVNGVSVAVNRPPLRGPGAGNSDYVEVIVTAPQPTFFMRVMHFRSMSVAARAVATTTAGSYCVTALNPSGTGIRVNGSSTVASFPSCSVAINSDSPNALRVNGNGTLSAQSISIVGGYSGHAVGTTVTQPSTGQGTVSDPLAGLPPPAYSPTTCTSVPNTALIGPPVEGGTVCYSTFKLSGTPASVTMKPGTYVITDNNASINNIQLSGTGVTIYIAPGASLTINSTTLGLSAPACSSSASCPYGGILFFEDKSNTRQLTISANADSTLSGIIYCPSANLDFNGGSNSTLDMNVIAGSITFSGGSNVISSYSSTNPESPLWKVKLAE